MNGFNLTYEVVTQASAEHGDAESRGYIAQALPLKDAIQLFEAEREGDSIEADRWPISAESPPRWFTAYGDMRLTSGDNYNVSLHIPPSISGASAMRIARLIGID